MSAEAAIQKALVAALKAHGATAALVGARVYDRVPPNAVLPYLHIGETQSVTDDTDCVDSVEMFVTIHAWSKAVGAVEARRIASAARAAIHRQGLSLDEPYALIEIEHRDTRVFPDANPILTHGVMVFRALVEG